MSAQRQPPATSLGDDALRPFLKRTRRDDWGNVPPLDLARFLAETLELLERLASSTQILVCLDDPQKRTREVDAPLTVVAARGPQTPLVVGKRIAPTGDVMRAVYRGGELLLESKPNVIQEFTALLPPTGRAKADYVAVAAAPIRLEQALCGAVIALTDRADQAFTQQDAAVVGLVSSYISRAILNAVDILKQNELAFIDELTGVRNLRGMHQCLDQEVTRAKRLSTDLAVLFLDLDRLKQTNDRQGHQIGSEALRLLGRVLQASAGNRGQVFRFGGDEFVVVCPNLSRPQGIELAEQIREEFAVASRAGTFDTELSVSIGVTALASLTPDESRPLAAQLLATADRALYRAKDEGRNRVCT